MTTATENRVQKGYTEPLRLLDYLKSAYVGFQPIPVEDIESVCPDAKEKLEQLYSEGKLNKNYGLYYYGDYLPPDEIVRYTYMGRNRDVQGYFVNLTAANMFGITTQMPFAQEIATNLMLEQSRAKKDIVLEWYRCTLYKPRTRITNQNYNLLSFLDLLCQYEQYTDYDKKQTGRLFREYAKYNGVSIKMLEPYLQYYPEYETCVKELELDDLFA